MADIKTNKDGTRTVTLTVGENFDDGLLNQLARQLERGNAHQVVGNLADLQRGGAEVIAGGGSMSDGVAVHPDVDEDDAKAGAQRTLDEEKEAKEGPAAVDPPKSTEPLTPKDPTSQSPVPAGKK